MQFVAVDVGGGVVLGGVRQIGVLGAQGRRVDADAGGSPLEPEAQDVLVLLADHRVTPVEVRLLGREQVQIPLAVRTLVQVSPENCDGQLLGGSSPFSPRPGRKWNSSRSALPGPAATAARNQACWSDRWLGTMSTMVRMPSPRASLMSFSASARVPKAGSMAR